METARKAEMTVISVPTNMTPSQFLQSTDQGYGNMITADAPAFDEELNAFLQWAFSCHSNFQKFLGTLNSWEAESNYNLSSSQKYLHDVATEYQDKKKEVSSRTENYAKRNLARVFGRESDAHKTQIWRRLFNKHCDQSKATYNAWRMRFTDNLRNIDDSILEELYLLRSA